MTATKVDDIPAALHPWPGHTGNWGRWPNHRGALNLVTPAVVLRATSEVRTGQVINCARPVRFVDPLRPGPAGGVRMIPSLYKPTSKYNALGDEITIRTHGVVNTHIDAFAHAGYAGLAFNGLDYADVINMQDGAVQHDVTSHGPIVTRGVLADIPRARGVPFLEPGDWVRPDEIEAAAAKVEPGDAFVIRTGMTLRPGLAPDATSGHHGTLAGVHWDCLELLARKDIAVFATDCGADVYPGPPDKPVNSPIHMLCLVMYGIPIVHNMDLEALADVCDASGRNTFLFSVAGLNVPRATGSPVTPFAVL